MAYIGKQPSTKFSAAAKVDTFTGDGSTVAFDLANTVPAGGENGLQVYVNNVRQKPGASNAYTLGNDGSGDLKRITFTEAPEASAEIYVITTYEATNIKNVPDGTITNEKIVDGAIDNAAVSPSAAIADTKLATISTSGKVATSAISQPGSPGVYLDGTGSWSAIDTSQQDTNAFNIGLLGFKMAVNEGLTVFNLVDGVVDEFNDESGTDEAEGSNDLYCGTSDYYINSTISSGVSSPALSAGFSMTTITEPDTSVAGTNPAQKSATLGTFTVPSGVLSLNLKVWGAGGAASRYGGSGGGGGFSTGCLSVTPGQSFKVLAGEGSISSGATPGFPYAPQVGELTVGGFGGGGNVQGCGGDSAGGGGGLSGIFNPTAVIAADDGSPQTTAPQIYLIAGSGGGGGYGSLHPGSPGGGNLGGDGGTGGGLTGDAGTTGPRAALEQTSANCGSGGGGDQEQGGQGGPSSPKSGQPGGFLYGGTYTEGAPGGNGNVAGGGSGYYGGGSGGDASYRGGGGGSSYIGNPGITCGSTEEGALAVGGGTTDPDYVAGTNEGQAGPVLSSTGEDGYVLLSASAICASATSTTIVSTAFSSTSVPTSARIVVFEENVDTPTLNTDIIASISRDGGTTFTNATLSDSGYVTGSSGQRILTGQATISGQPSGQSMRWKLALANNAVKIHGVSLQWA